MLRRNIPISILIKLRTCQYSILQTECVKLQENDSNNSNGFKDVKQSLTKKATIRRNSSRPKELLKPSKLKQEYGTIQNYSSKSVYDEKFNTVEKIDLFVQRAKNGQFTYLVKNKGH